jgi:SAM-dependent methyltransferase
MSSLHTQYPWLKITTTVEDYVAPDYYDRLLKPYSFEGKTDLEYFASFLEKLQKKPIKALELGPGTGRVTDCALQHAPFSSLSLVDLSTQMLAASRQRFSELNFVNYFQDDSLRFLEHAHDTYDLIYTLWSFSHSIHQLMIQKPLGEVALYVKQVLRKMVLENMELGSWFYLIHFDGQSDEQKILIEQWRKKYSFYTSGQQSPSKGFVDSVFEELQKEGVIEFSLVHHLGDEIVYESKDEALEIFLNFHLESHFNNEPYITDIIKEMETYFEQFTDADGRVRIKPGCFEYQVRKLV